MRFCTLLGAITLLAVQECLAFKAHDFKTCSQAGFCRRGRALSARANEAKSTWTSPYSIEPGSIDISYGQAKLTAAVKSSLYPEIKFGLDVRIQEDGVVRVRMDEVDGLRKRYDEAASWALIAEPNLSNRIRWTKGKKELKAVYGEKNDIEVIVAYQPLRLSLLRSGKEQIVLNGQGLLHMEHYRTKVEQNSTEENPPVEGEADADQAPLKVENPCAWFEGDTEDSYWEETFLTWTDSKPKGGIFTLLF